MIAVLIWILTAFSVLPPEFLDFQMLLQPLEEELYLPPVLIEVGNLKRGQMEGIGEERELTSLLLIIELDQSELLLVLP